MATISAQTISETGSTLTFTQVNASDTLTNDGASVLRVLNATAASMTVSIAATRTCSQGFTHNMSVGVPATTGDKQMGPFPLVRFGAAPVVTYTATTLTGVTAALFTVSG